MMICDSDKTIVKTIINNLDIRGKTILDIGCGNGNITTQFSQNAKNIVGIDADEKMIDFAKKNYHMSNTKFCFSTWEGADFSTTNFDIILFILSLHHIHEYCGDKSHDSSLCMINALKKAGKLISDSDSLVIIEPELTGSFIKMEETFNIGDGNERVKKKDAQQAIDSFTTIGDYDVVTKKFTTTFVIDNLDDLYSNIKIGQDVKKEEISSYLESYLKDNKFILDASRIMTILTKRDHNNDQK